MLCQNCGKNEAVTHIKQTVNGETREAYLCPECAHYLMGQESFSGFGWEFPDLFHSMLSFAAPAAHTTKPVRCTACGSTFQDIASSGKAGCAECYTVFYDQLLPFVERIHARASHVGKIPSQANKEPTKEQRISKLEEALRTAVNEQEFEEAARLRDQIKALKAEE